MATLEKLREDRITLIKELTPLQRTVREIETWFSKTDYYVNKVVRGEWEETEPKFVAYKKEAKAKAAELELAREKLLALREKQKALTKQIIEVREK
jgi:hypothetical protein